MYPKMPDLPIGLALFFRPFSFNGLDFYFLIAALTFTMTSGGIGSIL